MQHQFQITLFQFLQELGVNNTAPWFQENKSRYERDVLEPSLAFIREFGPRLAKISASFKG